MGDRGPRPVPEALRFGHRYVLRGRTRDGGRLVYASRVEKKVILCDEAGEILRTWDARISHEGRVVLLPSLDELVIVHETRLKSRGYRYEIVVYDIETGARKHEFVQDDGRELHAFYVAPTGSMFVLRLDDEIDLYDYREGRILDELAVPATARSLSYRFSPDGRFVKDLTLLWDTEHGDILCVVRGPSDTVMLHPNGRSLHLGAVGGPMIWSDK